MGRTTGKNGGYREREKHNVAVAKLGCVRVIGMYGCIKGGARVDVFLNLQERGHKIIKSDFHQLYNSKFAVTTSR